MKILPLLCSLCEPIWTYLQRSIRRQMMFGFGAAALMIMVATGYILHDQQRNALYREGIRHATTLANALAKSSSSWILENDVAGLQEIMSGLSGIADFKRAFVLAPNGEVLASTHPEEIGMFANDAISLKLLKAAPESHVLLDQHNLVDIAMPVMAGSHMIGWVRVELTRESANADLRRLDEIWLGFVLLAVLLVSLVSLLLSRTLTKGLNQLMSVTESVTRGNREVRANIKRGDEVGVLARNFNSMLDTLHESDLRFRQLAENIREVFWMTESDKSKVLYVSPVYELIWGRSVQSLIDSPQTWLESIHPDDRQRVTEAAEKQAEGLYDEEYRIIRPDAEIRWIHDRAFPIQDGKGHVYRIAGIAEDVTGRKQAEQALRASEERFKTMFVQAPLGIALIDSLSGRICEVNTRFAEIAGRTMEEMVNIDWLKITHPDDVQADLDNMALLNAGKINGFQMEKRYLHPDGAAVWINMTISPLKAGDKAHPRHLCMIQDITERKTAEARIKYLSRVYAVLSGINALIVRVSERGELFSEACRIATEAGEFRMAMVVSVDRSSKQMVSVASAGKDEELLADIKNVMSSSEGMQNTLVSRVISGKKAIISNDTQNDPRLIFGKKYAEAGVRSMVVLPLIVSDEAEGVLALYARELEFFHEEEMQLLTELVGDIAYAIDHIDKQERLNYLAYYDVLTGLANRNLFLERTAQFIRSAISGGHRLAIGMIDVERFKNINDSLGRTAGDALLKQVAEWLTYKTGDANLLARIDADHFALVFPEVRQDGDLARLVENTMEAFLQHPFRLNDTVFRISVRVGIALFPDDGSDADTLFRNAEAALKKAKASGDRYLFYTQKMTAAVAGKLTLENQLRQAIDNEEFVLHYQPKVNLVSGKVTSAEALIRWNDPRTGLVPPGKFIPILEETGLIYEVGRWALRKAIADYLRWRAAGLPAVRIAVNVSPLQLRNLNFIDEIKQKIGIDPHAAEGLELEITESLIMEDVKHNIASLQAIRAMGITIAIDDFGTGFSSLSYLAKLPVDTLKIDRSFVIKITAGSEGLALVSTIITLAHSLKLKVVAEGVETEEQSRQLLSLNCDEMQGFLFSKPVPAEIFETRFLAPPPAG
jgi:diguanylate cyclase (GGDEF)-like protein/PAS domain S-box-containing protein